MIQYAVEEAFYSGIEQICIIVSPKSQSVADYFDPQRTPNTEQPLWGLLETCEITFITQPEPAGIGDAILRAEKFIAGDSFAVIVPDTLFFSNVPGLKQVIDCYRRHQIGCSALVEPSQLKGLQRPGNYGFVDYEELEQGVVRLTKLYSKGRRPGFIPPAKKHLRTFGRSINKPELFDFIREVRRHLPPGSELDDVPVVQRVIQQTGRIGCILKGEGFDVGSLENYRESHYYLKKHGR